MGLLDDAIKEHLDLKRRRGADPDEIARQETEALGPVRRGEVDLAVRPVPVERPELDDEAEEPAAEHVPDGVPEARDDLPEAPGAAPAPATVEPEPEPPTRSRLEASGGQPTQEFTAIEADEALAPRRGPDPDVVAGDDADPDVLEETPEFLEETPEHDRLWFEQKPPKDFDF